MNAEQHIAAAQEAGWQIDWDPEEDVYEAWAPRERVQLGQWTSIFPKPGEVYQWRKPGYRENDQLWLNADPETEWGAVPDEYRIATLS